MKLKKLLHTAGVFVLTVAVAGCGLVQKNEEKDRAIVVAEVNGTKILKGTVLDEFERVKKSYGGISDDQIQQVKENILESLIEQEIILQKAKAAGFEVNDEIKKEARESYEKEILEYARSLQEDDKEKEKEKDEDKEETGDYEGKENSHETADKADEAKDNGSEDKTADNENNDNKDAGESDKSGETAGEDSTDGDNEETAGEDEEEEPVDQKYIDQAKEEIKEWLEYMNYTEEQYLERIAVSLVIQDFMEEQTKGITVEESEIKDYYDKYLELQKDNPSFLDYGYFPVRILKTPASRTVKHILIKIPDEDQSEINKLRNLGKKEDADKLLKDKLAKIKPKAQEVLDKAKAGEDFEELINKFNEDPGMEETAYKDGYEFTRDGSFVKSFKDASFAMKEGEISDLVESDYGYHIIKVYKAVEDEILPLDEVKDEIEETVKLQKQNEEWDKKIEDWVKKATIKKYPKRLK